MYFTPLPPAYFLPSQLSPRLSHCSTLCFSPLPIFYPVSCIIQFSVFHLSCPSWFLCNCINWHHINLDNLGKRTDLLEGQLVSLMVLMKRLITPNISLLLRMLHQLWGQAKDINITKDGWQDISTMWCLLYYCRDRTWWTSVVQSACRQWCRWSCWWIFWNRHRQKVTASSVSKVKIVTTG